MNLRQGILALVCGMSYLATPASGVWSTNDWQFLETIERANLRFFQEQKRGPYMLLNDNADYHNTNWNGWSVGTSVAGIGFELTAICLGHYRGWITYSNAYEQVLQQVRGFNGLLSADTNVFHRDDYGWTHHMYYTAGENAGKPYTGFDEPSMVDHSFFIAGCIFVSEYFKGTEAGMLARKLYEETKWSWKLNAHYGDFGYSENLLAIVVSAEAPQYKKGAEAYNIWRDYCIPKWPRQLELYFWEYPHSWVDFRFRTDAQRGDNHAIVARQGIEQMRQAAIDLHNADPVKYDMLGTNCWGWTAGVGSGYYRRMAPWPILGSNDVEWCCDSGSVTPIALPPAMVYCPDLAMTAMKHIFEEYYIKGWQPANGEWGVWNPAYGWINCFNKGKPYRYYENPAISNWFHPVNSCIDYGPNVLMLENYKLGTTWRWFMQNTSIASGMYTVGFSAPQNVTLSTFSGSSNHFGGGLGVWDNDDTPVTASYVDASLTNACVGDKVVRFVADDFDEGGWIDLKSSDQRAKAVLSFWVKGGTGQEGVRVGLVDNVTWKENKVTLADFAGGSTPTNWTEVKIPLEKFCLTGNVTNDTWPGSLMRVTFEFTNASGGSLDVDYLAFTGDTIPPRQPTNAFGAAMNGTCARLTWDPEGAERDVVGYHVWRRFDAGSGFEKITPYVVPAYKGYFDDTNLTAGLGEEIRYAIQAFDNAEPVQSSLFAQEQVVVGGGFDLDWQNGENPNRFGGSLDGWWGSGGTQWFGFVQATGPYGNPTWVRRSYVTAVGMGHYIHLAGGAAGDYASLSFWIKGARGGERLSVGLRDTNGVERKIDMDQLLPGGAVATNWVRVLVPLSDFDPVKMSGLDNISFTHEQSNDVWLADIRFDLGQRPVLVQDHYTEAEHFTRRLGGSGRDYKDAASGGEVLGTGWGTNHADYADYEFFTPRALTTPTLFLRYASDAGNGRTVDVQWNGVTCGTVACTNTGGWGDSNADFSWVTLILPTVSTGRQKLTFVCNGVDDGVNLDAWYLDAVASGARECEHYDLQSGSSGADLKAGASGGAVLGQSWGDPADSVAVYSNILLGASTGAWLHLWYAMDSSSYSGRVVDVRVNGGYRARLYCPATGGWGDKASHFERASAFIGALDAGANTVTLSVPEGGVAVNLDCFYIGDDPPEGFAQDADGDGLSDRQEGIAGTSASTTDTDGDGISDGDEVQFGRSGQVSDPSKADTDDDGMSDLEEAISGTDPNDESELFQCLEGSFENFPILGRVLRWNSATGRFYSVSVSTNLPDFCSLTSGLPATPTANVWTDTVSPDCPMLIYRIGVRR